jgi:trans-aconitate 2-methyltransferase
LATGGTLGTGRKNNIDTPPMTPADWDAQTYDRVADPMTRWGATVLDRLALGGDERVLDAGCGSGRVTEQLLQRLPRGQVVALDASPAMLDEAGRRLTRFDGRVEFVQADLAQHLPIEGTVDAILSTATFHWVLDQDALFHNLAAVLRPGGWLASQSGGEGNIARFLQVVAGIGDGWQGEYRFETPESARARLEAAGFVQIDTWLSEELIRFEPGRAFEAYIETVCLRPHLDRLPPTQRAAFVREVAERLPEPVLDYVRLNIVARRA